MCKENHFLTDPSEFKNEHARGIALSNKREAAVATLLAELEKNLPKDGGPICVFMDFNFGFMGENVDSVKAVELFLESQKIPHIIIITGNGDIATQNTNYPEPKAGEAHIPNKFRMRVLYPHMDDKDKTKIKLNSFLSQIMQQNLLQKEDLGKEASKDEKKSPAPPTSGFFSKEKTRGMKRKAPSDSSLENKVGIDDKASGPSAAAASDLPKAATGSSTEPTAADPSAAGGFSGSNMNLSEDAASAADTQHGKDEVSRDPSDDKSKDSSEEPNPKRSRLV